MVRQVAWVSFLPQIAVIAVLIFAAYRIVGERGIAYGALIYLALSFCLRHFVARDHRRGMDQLQQKDFAGAMGSFEKSYAFLTARRWIDDWRYLALLSSSRISYREMALLNVAFCAAQLEDLTKAREFYERTLKEFPESEMAKASLRMLNAETRQTP